MTVNNNKISVILYFYILYSLIVSIVFSVLLPIGQTPDELVHMKQMCDSFGIKGAYEQYVDAAYSYNLVESAIEGKKIDKEALAESKKITFDKSKINYNFHFNFQFLSYIPAFIGFIFGYIFNLPIAQSVWLAEFFNLIFAVIIGAIALYIMPIKKEMLLAVMTLPMCLHQYGSINYDAELLPLCFLLIALSLYLIYDAEKIKIVHLLEVLILMFVIATIKIPYALIGLIILTAPSEKIDIKIGKFDFAKFLALLQKYWYITVLSFLLIAAAALFLLKDQRYISLIVASILNPVHYARLIYYTLKEYFEFFYISAIGNFGYLSMPLPKVIVWIAYAFMLCLSIVKFTEERKTDDKKMKIARKVLFLFISFVIFNMIFMAMISHTFLINGLEYGPLSNTMDSYIKIGRIEGVQGRYFIPFFPLIFLCFESINKKTINKLMANLCQAIYYILMLVQSIIIVAGKLW